MRRTSLVGSWSRATGLAAVGCALFACGPSDPHDGKVDCSACPGSRQKTCRSTYSKCIDRSGSEDDCRDALDLYCRYGAFEDSDGGVGEDGGPATDAATDP